MTEITGARKKIIFKTGEVKKTVSKNFSIQKTEIPVKVQESCGGSYLLENNISLLSCYKTFYTHKGFRKPLSVYFTKNIQEHTRKKFFSLLEGENSLVASEQPNLVALAFCLSALCHVNIQLELGSPSLMYVYK